VSADADRRQVEQVLAGDAEAFAPIVQRWQGPLVNLAYRYCRDRGRAEEMAQEAFLKAYRSLKLWRRESSFSTWLFAVAANVYRSEMRRIVPPSVSLAEVPEIADPLRGDAILEQGERNRAIRRAVLHLPEKYRDVVTVFYFHEMSVERTSQTLGLREGTVKARLHRARGLLRQRLPTALPLRDLQEES
jgi:RNA polymerase sigma-70 factor (ECF subfamily)